MDRVIQTARRTINEGLARTSNAKQDNNEPSKRAAARKAYRAKIESLLAEFEDRYLAEIWQRVSPLPIEWASETPDRRGIINDLADLAEVLQPSLYGLKAPRLCRLIEKYAAHPSVLLLAD